jgi:hypothetical protein
MSENSDNKDGKKIFRYKLSDEVNDALALFTSLNRYNERKEIKNAWQQWCSKNVILVQDESRRLENLGYSGDDATVKKKMWTSVRYYHMKKNTKTIGGGGVVDGTHISDTNNVTVKKRRKYITLDREFLELIDKHINEQIKSITFTPARSYELFVDEYDDNIKRVVQSLEGKGLSEDDFAFKLKKTYKNRYFNIIK